MTNGAQRHNHINHPYLHGFNIALRASDERIEMACVDTHRVQTVTIDTEHIRFEVQVRAFTLKDARRTLLRHRRLDLGPRILTLVHRSSSSSIGSFFLGTGRRSNESFAQPSAPAPSANLHVLPLMLSIKTAIIVVHLFAFPALPTPVTGFSLLAATAMHFALHNQNRGVVGQLHGMVWYGMVWDGMVWWV
jgi:hypothetical protein